MKADRKFQSQSKALEGTDSKDAIGVQKADQMFSSEIAAWRAGHTSDQPQSSREQPPHVPGDRKEVEKLHTVPEDGSYTLPTTVGKRPVEPTDPGAETKTTHLDPPQLAPGLNVDRTPAQDPQDMPSADVHDVDTGAHNLPDSSRQSAGYFKRQDGRVNWLKDANMLPRAIPNARTLLYSYQDPLDIDTLRSGQSYLEKTANDLMEQLQKSRLPQNKYENVPIIFIGHGFGCMIILKVMELICDACEKPKDDPKETAENSKENKNTSKESKGASKQNKESAKVGKDALPIAIATAGIMFLDAPPLSSLETPWIRPWMYTMAIYTLNNLKTFFHEKHGKGICTAWFHDLPSISVRVRAIFEFP